MGSIVDSLTDGQVTLTDLNVAVVAVSGALSLTYATAQLVLGETARRCQESPKTVGSLLLVGCLLLASVSSLPMRERERN